MPFLNIFIYAFLSGNALFYSTESLLWGGGAILLVAGRFSGNLMINLFGEGVTFWIFWGVAGRWREGEMKKR